MLIQAGIILAIATLIFGVAVYLSIQNNKRAKSEKEFSDTFSNL